MRAGVLARLITSAAIRTMIAIMINRFGRVRMSRGPRRSGVAVLRLNPRAGGGPGRPSSVRRLRAIVELFLKVPGDLFAKVAVYA
jgi:hypothetical protein